MILQDKIREINERLTVARVAYYIDAKPIMSDKEYDALEKELDTLVASNPELASTATTLSEVGSDLDTNSGSRVPHLRPMLSIKNYYTKPEIVDWFNKVRETGAK